MFSKNIVALIALLCLAAQPIVAQTTYTFKCGTTIFICGDGLTQENVCQNSGTRDYVPKSLGDCSAMIDAVKSGNPYGAKCPVHDGKSLGISHYVEYYGCNAEAGTKFDNFVSSTCACPAGTCGPSICGSNGGGGIVGGDPHFRTHDGSMYSFHGECDLVMARSQSFGNGIGLDVHARTEMIDNTWSLVSNAAVRIGDDIFELNNNGTHYINGVADAILPATLANKYEIKYEKEIVNDGDNSVRSWYIIDLGNGDKAQITNYKKMISINVGVWLSDTVGMLGTSSLPGLVARDGQTLLTADEMGAQWQVNSEEAILFNEMRAPQYPESCRLPEVSKTHRRLGTTNVDMTNKAKAACHGVADNLYDYCLYDVMISGDVSLSRTYTAGVF